MSGAERASALAGCLKQVLTVHNVSAQTDFEQLTHHLPLVLSARQTAVLLIDPQKSFTSGRWIKSFGHRGEVFDLPMIRQAFNNCAEFLTTMRSFLRDSTLSLMCSRCPFKGDDWDYDPVVAQTLTPHQQFVIKPGNSILYPPSNGFVEWIRSMIDTGRRSLLIGGCTTNSCVRVSALEVNKHFSHLGLSVVVDLSLCGARTSNFMISHLFEGSSSVVNAVDQLIDGGVTVASYTDLV